MKPDYLGLKIYDSEKNAVKKMTSPIEKAKEVVKVRKFPQDQKGLDGFVLVPARAMYELYLSLYELGLTTEPWKPNSAKTAIEVIGQ